jgi:hypothetical protein
MDWKRTGRKSWVAVSNCGKYGISVTPYYIMGHTTYKQGYYDITIAPIVAPRTYEKPIKEVRGVHNLKRVKVMAETYLRNITHPSILSGTDWVLSHKDFEDCRNAGLKASAMPAYDLPADTNREGER